MLKKLLVATAVAAASTSIAFAANNGPYVGVDLGVNNSTFKLNDANNNQHNVGSNGALAGVFGGYSASVSPLVSLGGEAFINASNAQAKDVVLGSASTNLTLKTKYSYGLRFVPGLSISDKTSAYGILGVVRTRFDAVQSQATASKTDRRNVTGGQIGAGIQTDLTSNLALRGEYVYTNYRSFNTTMLNGLKPSTGQATLGLVYKFD